MFFAVVLLLLGVSSAQRPGNATICDWYAIQNFNANTTATQLKLMESILALAFGGAGPLQGVSSDITGIFNPGNLNGTFVDLEPWFNGSKQSTNLNNQAVSIDWLDGGGTAPLYSFLAGDTQNLTFTNGTNQALFSHWEAAFQRIFGCSQPAPQPPTQGGPLDLAYVHKFMDLNHTDVGHFINQLTLASQHFGFSSDDAGSLNGQMNAQFNVRCLPPQNGHLYSLCQDPSCPLAFPSPDCAPYSDLGPSGVPTPSGSSAVSTSPPSSTSSPASTSSAPPVQSSTTAAASSAALSPGGIAGASIGGAALLFLFIGALIFLFKRKNNNAPPQTHPYVPSNASYQAPSYNDQHMSYMSNPPDSGMPPMTTGQGYWTSAANQGGMGGGEIGGQMIAEMESPKNDAGKFGHLSVLSGGTLGEGGTSPASTAGSPGQQFARTTSPSPLHSGQMSPVRKPVGSY